MSFTPNYINIQDAAFNRIPERLPLYEHIISDKIMEIVLNREFRQLFSGKFRDRRFDLPRESGD